MINFEADGFAPGVVFLTATTGIVGTPAFPVSSAAGRKLPPAGMEDVEVEVEFKFTAGMEFEEQATAITTAVSVPSKIKARTLPMDGAMCVLAAFITASLGPPMEMQGTRQSRPR
jgi:hypothetical protein